ncbi:MAG: glycosyltransferase family 39 protein, partial [Deltaproteobacteria bacterium]
MNARAHLIAIAVVLSAAAALLFSRLGAVYLWQDEALTAILGERMMRYGKPLSWDGVNVLTQDNFAAEDFSTIDRRTGSADAGIRYFKARGDFKEDTTWVLHPWGQFLAAGLSLAALGHGTWQARLPFALAGLCTVLLLYLYAARAFASRRVALVAALLLTVNSFWILHARQCRYYALSSLALLMTFAAWDRWQRRGRFGAAAFVAAGFFYFQVEFGSFFPTMAVLAVLSVRAAWPRPRSALGVFAALAAAVAPFAWYYELYGRRFASLISFRTRFVGNLFNMNQYVVALPIVAAGAWMLWRRRDVLSPRQREVLVATVALVAVMLVWVPSVAPFHYHRYIVQLTPLAALLVAWTAGQVADLCAPSWRAPALAGCIAFAAVSALPSWPVTAAILAIEYPDQLDGSLAESVTRSELLDAGREIFEQRPDPNRATVEFLLPRLRP